MDLVEITYHDYLAEQVDGVYLGDWFTEGLKEDPLSTYRLPCKRYRHENPNDEKVSIANLCFTLGDDHVELYDCIFEKEPVVKFEHELGGRMATLVMKAGFKVKDGVLKGKICIRNLSKPPVHADYELKLNRADINQIAGFAVWGDGLSLDHCKYTFSNVSLCLTYSDNSKKVSVTEKITDETKKKLLEQYLLEYVTKDLCETIEENEKEELSIKLLVSDLTGADYSLRNLLRIHNRKLHTAFNNVSRKIMTLVNASIREKSPELKLEKIFGLVKAENGDKILKAFKGSMNNIDCMEMKGYDTRYENGVIVSNDADLVIVHVAIVLEDLTFKFKEISAGEVEAEKDIYRQKQKYKTHGAHFILSFKKLAKDKVEIKLVNLKLMEIKPSTESEVDLAMDYLVISELEKLIKQHLEAALTVDELQPMAINPDVEIEYFSDDFEPEDSENEE